MRMHSAAYPVARYRFICLSDDDGVETIKHIIKLFSPSGSHTVLVFQYQTLSNIMAMFRRPPPPNRGVECRWSMKKSQISRFISEMIQDRAIVIIKRQQELIMRSIDWRRFQ